MNERTGRIHALRGGSYTVAAGEATLVCRACGRFRNEGVTPLVGDYVHAEDLGNGEGYVLALLPRKNVLTRPPIANLDRLFLICSTTEPRPNLRMLDLLLAMAETCGIEPVIVFTKCDLKNGADLLGLYRNAGFLCCENTEAERIRGLLEGKTSAFCGNTGVGKSTLLNQIAPELTLPTGEISTKLGRGRHTTRHVELFPVAGGWVADTPGFGSLETQEQDILTKDNLAAAFREFASYESSCRFLDCAHGKDKGCAVLAAVERGEIAQSRHESYCAIYEALKQKKEWN
jgi:ribosome biogenesis GTPase